LLTIVIAVVICNLRRDGWTAEPAGDALQSSPIASSPTDEKLDLEKTFAHANALFEKAKSDEELREAAGTYRRILGQGIRNAHLYYNLGNTHLRLGEHGLAILYFRQALIFDPNNSYAESMLEYARRQVDRFKTSDDKRLADTVFFWHSRYSFSGRLWMLIVALLVFWVLLAMRIFTRIPFHRFSMTTALLIALAMGGSVLAEVLSARGEEAVLVAEQTEVRSGNGKDYDLVFESPIRSGVEVRILDTRNLWHQLEFPGGAIGWVPSSTARAVRDLD
jgi:tetratricopeptide (TPR) repeat protein